MDEKKINSEGRPGSVAPIEQLIAVLRGDKGCPWDRKQTAQTMAAYVIEEAHELAAAVADGDPAAVCDELGDVLFQLLFIAALIEEQAGVTLADVVAGNVAKMMRRHPHVFGTARADHPEAVSRQWHAIKAQERAEAGNASRLGDLPHNLPAVTRAYRLSERAARSGLDWPNLNGVMDKVREEWAEFEAAVAPGTAVNSDAAAMEFGDLLFTLINVARFIRVHPETALAAATAKFERRFRRVEAILAERGQDMGELSAETLDHLWEQVKADEPTT